MPNTFTLIASSTVGAGGAASIDFTSIPSTYTDLCLEFSVRSNYASTIDASLLRINGDTGSNYSSRYIRGDGSSVSSSSSTAGTSIFVGSIPGANATASTFQNAAIYFPNYAGSTNKSLSVDSVSENNATTAYALLSAGLWSSSAAITSLKLILDAGTLYLQHSTAYLYGIVKS
jgi:hypothetical protein